MRTAPADDRAVRGSPLSDGATRRAASVPLDELRLLDAVVGEGLILTAYAPDEPLEVHRIEAGRASLFGSFADAAAAWRALDDLDAPPDVPAAPPE